VIPGQEKEKPNPSFLCSFLHVKQQRTF